jgi:hypothetical protein
LDILKLLPILKGKAIIAFRSCKRDDLKEVLISNENPALAINKVIKIKTKINQS